MFKIVDDATASEIESEVEALAETDASIEGVTLIHVRDIRLGGIPTQKYTAVIKYQPNMNAPVTGTRWEDTSPHRHTYPSR